MYVGFKKELKRRWEQNLHTRLPINADGTAGAVAPELDELLYGEYAR
jgi:hypothetical protein